MISPVALDTSVLIRGIRQEQDPHDPKAVDRAKSLIAQLQEDGIPIVIPSIAIGEYLARTPDTDIPETLRVFGDSFMVEPFDSFAAAIAGKIQQKYEGLIKESSQGAGRQCVKSDIWILATAIMCGASALYVHEDWLLKFGAKVELPINILPVPSMRDKQPPLFDR